MSYIPISLSSARTKTSQIPISKVRKRHRFQSARTKTSQIPISKDENVPDSDKICLVLMRSSAIFRKICEKVRLGQKYAELCGEWRIMRNYAENRKLCDIALTALKCCLWKTIGTTLKKLTERSRSTSNFGNCVTLGHGTESVM